MRHAVLILLVAAAGVHCSAPVDEPSSAASEGDLGTAPTAPPPHAAPAPPSTAPPRIVPFENGVENELAARDGIGWRTTSSVVDDEGATYVTGTFSKPLTIGNVTLRSRGGHDVFLVKLAPDGTFQWARSVGSILEESSPRVSIDEGKINVIGLSKGQMDCGSGPLGTWNSDMFFVCVFVPEGQPAGGGTFPTGTPP